jgi:hypothetical protein
VTPSPPASPSTPVTPSTPASPSTPVTPSPPANPSAAAIPVTPSKRISDSETLNERCQKKNKLDGELSISHPVEEKTIPKDDGMKLLKSHIRRDLDSIAAGGRPTLLMAAITTIVGYRYNKKNTSRIPIAEANLRKNLGGSFERFMSLYCVKSWSSDGHFPLFDRQTINDVCRFFIFEDILKSERVLFAECVKKFSEYHASVKKPSA